MDDLALQLAAAGFGGRHDELLKQASDLDRRVERTLTEWTSGKDEGGRMKDEIGKNGR